MERPGRHVCSAAALRTLLCSLEAQAVAAAPNLAGRDAPTLDDLRQELRWLEEDCVSDVRAHRGAPWQPATRGALAAVAERATARSEVRTRASSHELRELWRRRLQVRRLRPRCALLPIELLERLERREQRRSAVCEKGRARVGLPATQPGSLRIPSKLSTQLDAALAVLAMRTTCTSGREHRWHRARTGRSRAPLRPRAACTSFCPLRSYSHACLKLVVRGYLATRVGMSAHPLCCKRTSYLWGTVLHAV